MNNRGEQITKKYIPWVWVLSIAIPIVVVILFMIKIPNVKPLTFLQHTYATSSVITAVVLVLADTAIERKKRILRARLMKRAISLSVVFLAMYVAIHMTSDPTPYGGKGILRPIYYFILISHILLSVGIIPMVLVTYVRAISKFFENHKKIARYTFPIWMYIAVTGVIVYLMISPYYV